MENLDPNSREYWLQQIKAWLYEWERGGNLILRLPNQKEVLQNLRLYLENATSIDTPVEEESYP